MTPELLLLIIFAILSIFLEIGKALIWAAAFGLVYVLVRKD